MVKVKVFRFMCKGMAHENIDTHSGEIFCHDIIAI